MANKQTPAAGHKAQAAARKPSKGTTQTPLAQVAATLAPAQAPAQAPAAPAQAPATVALRGGLAVQAVALTAKP